MYPNRGRKQSTSMTGRRGGVNLLFQMQKSVEDTYIYEGEKGLESRDFLMKGLLSKNNRKNGQVRIGYTDTYIQATVLIVPEMASTLRMQRQIEALDVYRKADWSEEYYRKVLETKSWDPDDPHNHFLEPGEQVPDHVMARTQELNMRMKEVEDAHEPDHFNAFRKEYYKNGRPKPMRRPRKPNHENPFESRDYVIVPIEPKIGVFNERKGVERTL